MLLVMRQRCIPVAAALALSSLGSACGKAAGPVTGSMLLAVVRDAEQQLLPVVKVEIVFFIPGGLGVYDRVEISRTGFIGRPATPVADVKDVDGDGTIEVVLDLLGNPFLDQEFSFHVSGNINKPFRVRAQSLDFDAVSAEGSTTRDTRGRDIVFAAGPEPIVEVVLRCQRPAGCGVDGGAPDAGGSSDDAAPDSGP
jgi:hypothetical protein